MNCRPLGPGTIHPFGPRSRIGAQHRAPALSAIEMEVGQHQALPHHLDLEVHDVGVAVPAAVRFRRKATSQRPFVPGAARSLPIRPLLAPWRRPLRRSAFSPAIPVVNSFESLPDSTGQAPAAAKSPAVRAAPNQSIPAVVASYRYSAIRRRSASMVRRTRDAPPGARCA